MKLRTAFEAAVAKFPERERRVALATFAVRYAHRGWPVTDYRCVGADAEAIKAFLAECGLAGAFEDVASSLDPSSHMIKWRSADAAAKFAEALVRQLPDAPAQTSLYVAQLDRSRNAAAGLADEPESEDGELAFWDPLGLVASTRRVAEALAASDDSDARAWANWWLSEGERLRPVMAPLWVIEAADAEGRGLFTSGGFLKFLGRYVKRDESLVPPFPAISGYPVSNTWGDGHETHRYCPLDGYVQRTVGDLADVPPDPPRTPAESRRDAWMHVESAYVGVDGMKWDALKLVARPKDLWDYVVSLYERAYGRRVVLVPGECLVHAGRVGDDLFRTFCSADDEAAMAGKRLEVRPSVVFLDEAPDASKPSGAADVGADATSALVFPGETPEAWTRSEGRSDLRGDAAAEWYAMTHASSRRETLAARPSASDQQSRMAAFRKWAKGAHSAHEAALPEDVFLGVDYFHGYNGAAHAACGIVDEVVGKYRLDYVQAPNALNWKGAHAELHMAPRPVVAVYSSLVGGDSAAPDMTQGGMDPESVSKALDALADPAVQLALPDAPEWVQVVVETNIQAPAGGFSAADMPSDTTRQKFLKDTFLWAFQANRPKEASLTMTAFGCDVSVHANMFGEMTSAGRHSPWPYLWGASERPVAHAEKEWEDHVKASNRPTSDVFVETQVDSFGRLVFVFALKFLSPAEAVCRATFRWFAGLPLVPNEGMAAAHAAAAAHALYLDPDNPAVSAAEVVARHMEEGASGVVPGWTGMRTPAVVRYTSAAYVVPERSLYDCAACGMPQVTAAQLASRA